MKTILLLNGESTTNNFVDRPSILNFKSFRFLLLFLFLAGSFTSFSQTWTGATSGGDWQVASNWTSPAAVPVAGGVVIFNTGTSLVITNVPNTYTAANALGSLTVSKSTALTPVATSVELQANTTIATTVNFTSTGSLQVDAGCSLIIKGSPAPAKNLTLTLPTSANASATINGTLTVAYNTGVLGIGAFSKGALATMTIGSTGIYNHNINNGTIPGSTTPANVVWDAASTLNINGYVSGALTMSAGETYGNVNWNCPSQTGDVQFSSGTTTIQGNLDIINTNTGKFRIAGAANTTLNINGNLKLQAGTFSFGNTAAITGTVNLKGDFERSASTTVESTTLNSIGQLNINKGSGRQSFTNPGSFTGTGAINVTVSSGSTLQFTDGTHFIDDNGLFTLSSGAILGIKSADGINLSTTIGHLRNTNGKAIASDASYLYK
jgi:fibronectin-binding autotransporter adhesin